MCDCEGRCCGCHCMEEATIGKKAPKIEAKAYFPDDTIKPIVIDESNKKYKVLLFYPLDFSLVCPSEISGFNDVMEAFEKNECELYGISVDSVLCHKVWCATGRENFGVGKLKFPLISDIKREISIQYGMYDFEGGTSRRGMVIIDKNNKVRYIQINDAGIGRSTEETLRVVEAIKFSDENWKKHRRNIESS